MFQVKENSIKSWKKPSFDFEQINNWETMLFFEWIML